MKTPRSRLISLKRLRPFLLTLLTSAVVGIASTVSTHAFAKTVYLTFDDGPDPRYTPRVLDVLRQEHVQATFFVLGSRSEQFPRIVRRIHNDGHEIGNHGYYHTFIVHKSKNWVQSDINRADAVIQAACGVKPKFFRPPGGILSRSDVDLVSKTGHPVAMWTVDTNDWKAKNPSAIVEAVQRATQPNAIILMHDGTPSSKYTIQALPVVIRYLRASGYTFATLPEQYQGKYIGRPTDTTNFRFKK